ncbi:MAG: prephenate dehydrogenase [Eubacterium sp.]|jgi:prephenate dehydrogenase|uniref:prephenate dehydrogenase n=1 Tax=Eubacterium sp. F2 TaxID=3381348 RepID=UPI0039082B88|nr:prephenate dehydrogenase [Eubacterium sp.]MCI2196684.1 prephenate dehydrogenase [Eubacterium sp.]
MKVGIVGLGLIGGSLARALKASGAEVYGYDVQPLTLQFVQMQGSCDEVLDENNVNECDYIFLAIPPKAAEDWLKDHAEKIGKREKQPVIMDCCGVKRSICKIGFELEKTAGITFVSTHPMAGRENWGFKNSEEDMFEGAVCAVIPSDRDRNNLDLMGEVKDVLRKAGFSRFSVMTPDEHDEVIAFTSQLSHLVSSSFVKCDDGIREEAEVAGGSFRDMTRVAFLNEHVWADLFLENRDNLLDKLNLLIGELQKYREALENNDRDELTDLLAEGREEKEILAANAQ